MDFTIIAIISIYFIGMFFIGVYANKKTVSVSDYYVGGRNLGGLIVALVYFSSLVSAGALIGWTGLAGDWGMFFIYAASAVTVSTFVCWYFLGKKVMHLARDLNLLTIPDFIEERYESKNARLLASIILIVFAVPLMVSQYKAAGLLFNMVTGIPYEAAVIGFGVLVFLYVAAGGYLAVAYTDLVQGLIMLFGMVTLIIVLVTKVGGLPGHLYAELNPSGALSWPSAESAVDPSFFLSFLMLNFFGALGAPNYIRGFYTIKSGKELKRGFTIIVSIVVVIEVLIVLYGLYGRVLFPDLNDPDMLMLTMIKHLLHPVLAGVMLTALAAAMMSTMDSLLITISSTVENDILSKYFKVEMTQKKRLRIAQITTLIVGIISVVWGLYPPALLALLLYPAWGVLGLTFAVAFYGGLYWKRFNASGINTFFIVVSITFTAWNILNNPLGIYPIQAALLLGVPLSLIATYATSPTSEATLDKFFNKNKKLV